MMTEDFQSYVRQRLAKKRQRKPDFEEVELL
jgi:hypothetical protein